MSMYSEEDKAVVKSIIQRYPDKVPKGVYENTGLFQKYTRAQIHNLAYTLRGSKHKPSREGIHLVKGASGVSGTPSGISGKILKAVEPIIQDLVAENALLLEDNERLCQENKDIKAMLVQLREIREAAERFSANFTKTRTSVNG